MRNKIVAARLVFPSAKNKTVFTNPQKYCLFISRETSQLMVTPICHQTMPVFNRQPKLNIFSLGF